ncbi:hypothetical protein [Paenibacillus eucommiae]|uniref:Uncharacterized protein n=1 Tax=Paenibacillus eucommiae TaxID=1355755 RepID=A0ABS4IV18_9BACL|nr:hypothetical protein [Paenibacillus eucommiae]MBP1990841.1 hypothetical protein [Paenibacillus eucommiae]
MFKKQDAIQLSIGQAHFVQERIGKQKPFLGLRSDKANDYGNTLPSYLYSQLFEGIVEQARDFLINASGILQS